MSSCLCNSYALRYLPAQAKVLYSHCGNNGNREVAWHILLKNSAHSTLDTPTGMLKEKGKKEDGWMDDQHWFVFLWCIPSNGEISITMAILMAILLRAIHGYNVNDWMYQGHSSANHLDLISTRYGQKSLNQVKTQCAPKIFFVLYFSHLNILLCSHMKWPCCLDTHTSYDDVNVTVTPPSPHLFVPERRWRLATMRSCPFLRGEDQCPPTDPAAKDGGRGGAGIARDREIVGSE